MAKYPVEYTDAEGIVDGLNYVLSGPAGLGQNFAGFSESATGYLTGNFRVPYSETFPVATYVAPISLSTAEMLDGRTFKFTFSSTQASPPFKQGNNIQTYNFDNDWYNDFWSPIGVVECTVDYVIVRTGSFYPDPGPDTNGGTVYYSITNTETSTDCNARVTVTGPTDRVFINAQLNNNLSYLSTITTPLYYSVRVNRYKGEPTSDPVNPDYIFDLDDSDGKNPVVAERIYYAGNLNATQGQVTAVTVTGGVNHIPRTSYPRTYSVQAEATTGSGTLCTLDIELRPGVVTSDVGLSSGGPYFGPTATSIPYRTEPWNFKTPTAVAEAAGILTITVNNAVPAFTVGQSVTLTGADPYNGTYKVITATPTYIEVETTVTGAATLSSPQVFASFFNTVITIADGGIDFVTGDTLLVKGSQIGGVDGTNDMTLEVTATAPGSTITLPTYDTVFTSIIDVPGPGYYWYILEIEFITKNTKSPTAVEEAGGILTITVDNSFTPFLVGQSIKLVDASPYDDTYTIIASTPTYIQVATALTGPATLDDPVIYYANFDSIELTQAALGYRGLSAQVVKE